MKALTYEEWRATGYAVKQGETSSGRNRYGEATFTRSQVTTMKSFDYRHDGLRLSEEEKERRRNRS